MSDDTMTIGGKNYARVYSCELEPGDVLALGPTVRRVDPLSERLVILTYSTGETVTYNRTTTLLVLDTTA